MIRPAFHPDDFDDLPFDTLEDAAGDSPNPGPDADPLDPDHDCFKPPSIPTLVHCLHCGEEYDSFRIEWRVETDAKGKPHGFWCCPMPGCDGRGFGFDIWPVDPDYIDPDGREMGFCYDDDEEDDELWDDEDDDFDPDELLSGPYTDSDSPDDSISGGLAMDEPAGDDLFSPPPRDVPPWDDDEIPY